MAVLIAVLLALLVLTVAPPVLADRVVANAGPDRIAPKYRFVWLDGRGSYDELGDVLTFRWTQVEGPAVSLSGANSARAYFVPKVSGTYAFELEACASDGTCDTDDVTVVVPNAMPIPIVQPRQTGVVGYRVTLYGASSWDPDGDRLACAWLQLSGPAVALEKGTDFVASFIPFEVGTYEFALRVDDGDGGIASSVTVVTVLSEPLVAISSPARGTAIGGEIVEVSGTADGATVVQVRIAGGAWWAASGTDAWTVALDASALPDGDHLIEARALHVAKESARAVTEVRLAIPPPSVAVSLAPGATLRGLVVVAGSATPGAEVRLTVDDHVAAIPASDGSWEYALDTSTLADGVHRISVQAVLRGRASAVVTLPVLVVNRPEVVPPGPTPLDPSTMYAAAGTSLAALGVGAWLSERLRIFLFWPFFILWVKLRKENLLDNETRGMIRGYLAANPGANFLAIRDDLKLTNGTLEYHLKVLERHGLIDSWADGRFRRFALHGQKIADLRPKLTDVELLLIQVLQEQPDLYQAEIATVMGLSRATISYHMKKLSELGVVTSTRVGVRKQYRAIVGEAKKASRRGTRADQRE